MINAADWKSKTSREWHYRSGDLEAVDEALDGYDKDQNQANFKTLQEAFANWYKKNPKEATKRDKDHCVQQLRRQLDRQKCRDHYYIGFNSIVDGDKRRDRAIFAMNKLREFSHSLPGQAHQGRSPIRHVPSSGNVEFRAARRHRTLSKMV